MSDIETTVPENQADDSADSPDADDAADDAAFEALADDDSADDDEADDSADDDEADDSVIVTIPTDTVCFAGDVIQWGKLVPLDLFNADAEPISVLAFTPSDTVPLTRIQRKWRNLLAAYVKDSRIVVRRQEARERADKLESKLAKLRAELAKLEADVPGQGTQAENEAADGVTVIAPDASDSGDTAE